MDSKEIPILPVRCHKETRPKGLAEQLPAPPFLGVIVAPVKSGKSVLLCNLIMSSRFYRGLFDEIVLFSPNAHQDESIKPVADSRITTVHTEYDDEIIRELCERADDYEDDSGAKTLAHQKPSVLLVFDDMLGNVKQASEISRLATKYRQRNFSIIITTQVHRAIPLPIRTNATWYIVFATHNRTELDKMTEEFNAFPNFEKLYEEATSEPYSFLFLDIRNMLARKRFQKKVLWEKHPHTRVK